MSFCLGIKVEEGLIGIADTRVTSGSEVITARKVTTYQQDNHSMFLMTSGLRSVRDKALTYFEEYLELQEKPFDRIFKAVNGFAEQIRIVVREDGAALKESGLPFNIYSLVGGQLEKDSEHKLYMIYPEGNWVEISKGTPYLVIGETGYGKPILDRTLKFADPISHALKVGCLAFDSTRISASDVDFPVDIVIYFKDTFRFIERRYERQEVIEISNFWQEELRELVNKVPAQFIDDLLRK